MSFNTNWDVSKYRSPYEPNYQWELRKKFMELNKDRFSEERIVCLAQTFANIEFMGCRYPKATMDLVEELSYGVVQEYRERQKHVLQRTFVSGSDAAESKVNRRGPKQKLVTEQAPSSSVNPASLKYGRFVSASTKPDEEMSTHDTNVAETSMSAPAEVNQHSVPVSKYSNFTPQVSASAPVEVNRNSVPASKYSSFTSSQTNSPEVEQVQVSPEKEGSCKRKPIVWDLGEPAAKKPPPQQQKQQQHQQRQQQQQQQRQHPNQRQSNNRANNRYRNNSLSNFVIVRLADKSDENCHNILARSSGFSKMPHKLSYTALRDGRTRCDVTINDQTVATSVSDLHNDARDAAQQLAIETLSQQCYTLIIKNKYLSDGGATIGMESLENADQANDALQANNVGHKLLQMMGWSGGGLGKEGSGISEPITAQAIFNRQGLGASTNDRDFKGKIRKIIEEYAQSNNTYDLVFSSGFDNQQRKEMHDIARRLGLKSKSFGKKEDRFITISRKFSGDDIIQELLEKGGSNEKYDLLPPSAQ